MIHVTEAPEPASFDKRVRQRGLSAIAELVGEKPSSPRRGGRRYPKIASRREDIPARRLPPLWREVLPEMLQAYERRCAYLALYIECGTGGSTIDHVIPKSMAWNRVYEWPNYRLACALMNSRKGNLDTILDPFEIEDDWFAMEFFGYQVTQGRGAKGEIISRIEETISRLRLNDVECCRARQEYVDSYTEGDISLRYLQIRAPFIAREMKRQGLLRPSDR